MRQVRTITDVESLLDKPEITIFYRDNSLYRAISRGIIRMLNKLGYRTHHLILEGHATTQQIRTAAGQILSPYGGGALVLPDHTCWRVTSSDPEFAHLKYPFEHLDTVLSDAAIASMYARTSIPPSPETIDTIIEAHFDAFANLFGLIKDDGFEGTCHVVQNEIAEHSPFVVKLIQHLMKADAADVFPPVREVVDIEAMKDPIERRQALANAERMSRLCDQIEEPLAVRIAETIARVGIRTELHQKTLPEVQPNDIVVCDQHYLKRHEALLEGMRVLPLPLASLIAHACEDNLLPIAHMTQLMGSIASILAKQHQKLKEREPALFDTEAV